MAKRKYVIQVFSSATGDVEEVTRFLPFTPTEHWLKENFTNFWEETPVTRIAAYTSAQWLQATNEDDYTSYVTAEVHF